MDERNIVTLTSAAWQLVLEPEVGVQWLAARVKPVDANTWTDIAPDCLAPDSELPAANFHMIPYSNRIRDGKFSFDDHTVSLDEGEHHAIHGALRKLPWQTVAQTTTTLVCQYETSDQQKGNWPWPMKAVIRYLLDDTILHSRIDITNTGTTDMPVGAGWHPYFVRTIQGAGPTLTLPVGGVFPDANGDCLPDGAAVALPDEIDFRQPRRLDANQFIDCCLAGLAGDVVISWPHADIELTMQASENCRYLVLFNPQAPYFAVEPVTNANDGFNLQAAGIAAGSHRLPPGETFTARLAISANVPALGSSSTNSAETN